MVDEFGEDRVVLGHDVSAGDADPEPTEGADGIVDEVRGLLERGLRDGTTAVRAIGYRQVVDFLDGAATEEEAKAAVKRATRTFFRKQLGWYRRDPRIEWLPAGDPANVERIVAAVGIS